MSGILNEVELKKEQRKNQKIDQLKKAGKTKEEIEKELEEGKKKSDEKKEVIICKTVYDDQKRKLDRLMKNPSKEVYIPQPRKEWKPRDPAEFVRHVMGSSAGAGSGEFHVYRNIRKREMKRQEYLEKKSKKYVPLDEEINEVIYSFGKKHEIEAAKSRVSKFKELDELDEEFQERVEENKIKADEATSKKRAKRQKRKQKKQMAKKVKQMDQDKSNDKDNNSDEEKKSESDDGSEDETEEEPHFKIGGK